MVANRTMRDQKATKHKHGLPGNFKANLESVDSLVWSTVYEDL